MKRIIKGDNWAIYLLLDNEDICNVLARIRINELLDYFKKKYGYSYHKTYETIREGIPFEYYGVEVIAVDDE